MANKNIKEMTDEQLQKQLKTTKFLVGLLGGAIFVAFVLNIINFVNKKSSFMKIVPSIALMPIFAVILKSLKDLKNEMKQRGLMK